MKRWVTGLALVALVCGASIAHASNEANHLGTSRGSAPWQRFVSSSVGTSTNKTAVTGVPAAEIVVVGLSVSNANGSACLIEFRNGASTGDVLWSANVLPGYVASVTAPTGGFIFETGFSANLNIKNSCAATTYYNLSYVLESGVMPTETPVPTPTPTPTPTAVPTPTP